MQRPCPERHEKTFSSLEDHEGEEKLLFKSSLGKSRTSLLCEQTRFVQGGAESRTQVLSMLCH